MTSPRWQARRRTRAGALMTTDYAWVPGNITVAEVFDRLRLQAPDSETIYYVFVLDEDRKLLGVVTLRKLVLRPRHALVRDVMEQNVVKVRPERGPGAGGAAPWPATTCSPCRSSTTTGRLIGIVTHDDVIDVVVRGGDRGRAQARRRRRGASTSPTWRCRFWTMVRKRAGWLVILFLGEMLTATAMGYFEDEIEKAVVLALFVPLIISSGGNSRLAGRHPHHPRHGPGRGPPEATGGASCAAKSSPAWPSGRSWASIGFLRIALWSAFSDHLRRALGARGPDRRLCRWSASCSGARCPARCCRSSSRRLGFDPATSSAPFVATLVDVTGLIIYFTVAFLLLQGTLL